jgi:hypothetical protein
MHHDLLAELIESTCCFKSLGGISMLNSRDRRQVGRLASKYGATGAVVVL